MTVMSSPDSQAKTSTVRRLPQKYTPAQSGHTHHISENDIPSSETWTVPAETMSALPLVIAGVLGGSVAFGKSRTYLPAGK